MSVNELNSNKLASNMLYFVEIYKELSKINQNINHESSKLHEILVDKNFDNDENMKNIDLIIKNRENQLNKLKNL